MSENIIFKDFYSIYSHICATLLFYAGGGPHTCEWLGPRFTSCWKISILLKSTITVMLFAFILFNNTQYKLIVHR